MQTIILKVNNNKDLFLLTQLAERLGISVVVNKNETAPVVQNENRKWKYIGALKLNGQLDNVNLRDFAYE